jgi:hypothetical protein
MVDLMRAVDDVKLDSVTSDGTGAFAFRSARRDQAHYLIAYKPGSPDIAGTTVNTLTPTGS